MKHKVFDGPDKFEIATALLGPNIDRKNFLIFRIERPEIPGDDKSCLMRFSLVEVRRIGPHDFAFKGKLHDDIWLQKILAIDDFEYSTATKTGYIVTNY